MNSHGTYSSFLFLTLLNILCIAIAQPSVTELSLSPASYISAVGSLEGGTLVYVKGSGFGTNNSQVVVEIGPYPCVLESNGTQNSLIVCRTTKAINSSLVSNLQTKVTANGYSTNCFVIPNCVFNYQSNKTSFLEEIFQRTAVPNELVYSFGSYALSSASQIQKIMIGDKQCAYNGTFGTLTSRRAQIKCRVDATQVAGEYDYSMDLSPGYPTMSRRTVQTSFFTGKNYTQRIAAQITNITSRKCGRIGTRLNVTGTGFSTNVSAYTCTIAGETCTVTQASANQLTIEIPRLSTNNTSFGKLQKSANDNSTQTGAYLGNNGFFYQRYSFQYWNTMDGWLKLFRNGNVSYPLQEQRVLSSLRSPQIYGSQYLQYFRGYFFAPVDGLYQFSAVVDDYFYINISTVQNNTNPSNLQKIIDERINIASMFNSLIDRKYQSSFSINMTKGYYFMQGVSYNGAVTGYFNVYVDMPSLRQYSGNPAWQVDQILIYPSTSGNISGTFRLLVNGTPLIFNSTQNLPNSIAPLEITSMLNRLYNTNQISVLRVMGTNPSSSIELIIQYVGLFSSALPITLDTSLIVPLNSSSTILKSVEVLREYPNRQRYSPIPFDFLYMASNTTSLRLTVNSIPVVCFNCTFQYIPAITSTVTFLSRSGPTFQMSISDPASTGIQLSDISITMSGVPCVNLSSTFSNFTCSIPANADGSALLPAGTVVPQILVPQVGYANTDALPLETIPLIVSSFQPPESSLLGGIEATVIGSGFPISSASAASLNISICGNSVPMSNVTYISNQQLKLIIPAEMVRCTGSNNIIYYNGQQSSFAFSYNPCLVPKEISRCANKMGINLSDINRENFMRVWSNVSQWSNQILPPSSSRVEVPYEWNLLLDISPPVLDYLEVNGNLVFDNTQDLTLQSHYIWVNKGTIKIGSESMPYSQTANIVLHGENNDFQMVIDKSASGNKILAVTGGLELYGQQPGTSWTKLTRTALVGDNQIAVSLNIGWKAGDQIVIAPSYSNSNESEQVIITAISGNLVSFTPPLSHQHYGAPMATIANSFGTVDTRSAVGLLTRNIKISSAASASNWGGRVLIYGYYQPPAVRGGQPTWRNGYAKLRGVEIEGCGQLNTTQAALRIEKINTDSSTQQEQTLVDNSVIHNCQGSCVFMSSALNVSMSNNLFYHSRGSTIFLNKTISGFNFSNNLLVGTTKLTTNDQDENLFGFLHLPPSDFSILQSINVSNNLLQGSEGAGFALPVTECSRIGSYSYSNNTAGTCEVAFVYESATTVSSSCLAAKGAIAYASKVGLMANLASSNLSQVEYSQMMFADNLRAVSLRFCHQSDDNTLIFKDSFISGVSRPSCPSCYSSSKISYCQGAEAVRMLAVTANRTGDIFQTPIMSLDQVNTQQSFDAKAFLNNVRFENFFYSNSSPSQPPFCTNMAVFKRNTDGSDSTASHYLTNTTCVNCQPNAWAYFDPPSVADRPQCGGIDCTGPNNYLIDDQDGKFTGRVSQILANNSVIGDHESSCQSMPAINGHWCNSSTSFAVLEYESEYEVQGQDRPWQVHLNYDGGLWNSTTNAFKQQNDQRRSNRFWSVVRLNRTYSLNQSSAPPVESRYRIQKRQLPLGNQSDWIIVRLKYPQPISVEVIVSNSNSSQSYVSLPSLPIVNNMSVDLQLSQSDNCGAHVFNYDTSEVSFVVNSRSNCQVRVRFRNAVRLLLRLDSTFATFTAQNKLPTVLARLISFLKIQPYQLRLTKLSDGGSYIELQLLIQSNFDYRNAAMASLRARQVEKRHLSLLKKLLDEGFTSGSLDLGQPVLSAKSEIANNAIPDLPESYDFGDKLSTEDLFVSINLSLVGVSVILIVLYQVVSICKQNCNNKIGNVPGVEKQKSLSIQSLSQKEKQQLASTQ